MSESKELTVPERAAVALGTAEHEKALIELSKKYADIVEIKNPAGREQAHAAYMTLKNARIAIEKAGKDARDDAVKFGKAVITEVDRLTAITADEERRLQNLRDTFDAEREAERLERLAAEKARVDGIRRRIAEMQAIPSMLVGKQSATIGTAIEGLESVEITLETHQEFAGEAEVAKLATVRKLWEMFAAQQAVEAEQARIAAEREALERQRAELAEQERKAEAARREQEAKDRAERERVEVEQRAAREKAEAAIRAEREDHERRMAAEREAANAAWLAQHEAEQASLRAQQEAADKLAAAMSEIQGIQQQVIIATQGRLGVRKGGTIECLRDTLAETEAWEIDDRFGILRGSAESAKTTAVAEIRRLLAEAEARVVAEAAAKLEADHVEAIEENARIDAERRTALEAQRQEDHRRAAEAERIRRELAEFESIGPDPDEMLQVLADHYDVSAEVARHWLTRHNWMLMEIAA